MCMCVCFSLRDELMKTEAIHVNCAPESLCVCAGVCVRVCERERRAQCRMSVSQRCLMCDLV